MINSTLNQAFIKQNEKKNGIHKFIGTFTYGYMFSFSETTAHLRSHLIKYNYNSELKVTQTTLDLDEAE